MDKKVLFQNYFRNRILIRPKTTRHQAVRSVNENDNSLNINNEIKTTIIKNNTLNYNDNDNDSAVSMSTF